MEEWIESEQRQIAAALERALPAEQIEPQSLHRAMRYSVLGGGKRLRPMICRAAAWAVAGQDVEAAMGAACSLELIHAYSLIHDDLPAIDNDALRRGRPTCHKAFGEATAILAGDSLLTLSFQVLSSSEAPAARIADMVVVLSEAAGTPYGMAAGQAADLNALRAATNVGDLESIHRRKTGALFRAAALLGGMAAEAGLAEVRALGEFGADIGLAFQIADDILDVTGSTERMGKTLGKDDAQKKVTYPAVVGLEASHRAAQRLAERATSCLSIFGDRGIRLRQLAGRVVDRRV